MDAEPLGFSGPGDLVDLVGVALAPGPWQDVSDERLSLFNLAVNGPGFSSRCVSDFFLISLLGPMIRQTLVFNKVRMGINYGLDDVHWNGAVRGGDRARLHLRIKSVSSLPDNGKKLVLAASIEVDRFDTPALTANCIGYYYV